MKKGIAFSIVMLIVLSCTAQLTEPHRPAIHFTPQKAWMNDPNGMVYHNDTYHLFYQYYPNSTVWGPMHWGHATSTNLVQWQHQPVALYPDRLGYIFSGSAVVDKANTSGFGKNGKPPLVAIFTHHDPKGEKLGSDTFQYQSLAYSLDDGKTWTKYARNPVLRNPGIRDFRDPKVRWNEESQRWTMTLAVKDHIEFHSSPNLKDWQKESDFGAAVGAHGGVWECPDLFPMQHDGKTVWVLLVSLNPGGPNGGSATQYFVGDFDGKTFTPYKTDTRWIDYGPDNYAGVTWSNTGNRILFMGWMSNWDYATKVPTKRWRSAMTIPRELSLTKVAGNYLLVSNPVAELTSLEKSIKAFGNVTAKTFETMPSVGAIDGPSKISFTISAAEAFTIAFSNSKGQQLTVGYDKAANNYFIDRTAAGKTSFAKDFAKRLTAPRLSSDKEIFLTMVVDRSSIELFADGGLSVMTAIFFPDEDFKMMRVASLADTSLKDFKITRYKPSTKEAQASK